MKTIALAQIEGKIPRFWAGIGMIAGLAPNYFR
jgi:hypothetical protein